MKKDDSRARKGIQGKVEQIAYQSGLMVAVTSNKKAQNKARYRGSAKLLITMAMTALKRYHFAPWNNEENSQIRISQKLIFSNRLRR